MILKNAYVFIKGKFIKTDIKINTDTIASIGTDVDPVTVDCSDKYILPGLVDIHTHGCAGFDFSSADTNAINTMREYYLMHGITTILATTVSLSDDEILNAVNSIKISANKKIIGADIAGINLEGPYLSAEKCGAHDSTLLKEPNIDFINSLGDMIKIVNVAPEYSNALEFIKNFRGKVSIAHTSCDYDTAIEAIALGADHITHIFNAMNGLHHRKPGVIGAFFDTDAVAEMICDSIHIAPPILRMMFKSYCDRIAIISDSMAATGLNDGAYKLGSLNVNVKNSIATLPDGTLAGSAMNLYDMMRNLISIGVKPEKAIESATYIPAKSINISDSCGVIDIGRKADLVIANNDFTINNVVFKGQLLLDNTN